MNPKPPTSNNVEGKELGREIHFTCIKWFSVHNIVSASPIKSDECFPLASPQFNESINLSIKGWKTYN